MQHTLKSLRTPTIATLGILVAFAVPVMNLVNRFGINYWVAKYIVQLVVQGLAWLACVYFPWLSPFIGLVKLLISWYGAPYVINW